MQADAVMNDEREGYEVLFKRFYEDEFDLWLFTEDYTIAATECDLLMEKDHVCGVKLMQVKSVQVMSLSKPEEKDDNIADNDGVCPFE